MMTLLVASFRAGIFYNRHLRRRASQWGWHSRNVCALAGGTQCSYYVLISMTNERPANWRMPSRKQMEKLLSEPAGARPAEAPDPAPSDPMPEQLWDAVLRDPRAAGKPWLPIQQCRLSEIPRHVLRIGCQRCSRIVEIQKADALRFYGQRAIWKDVGQRLA